MIPQKLSLRNFMCYREDAPTLDFSGIHLACISGDNGHGKSALLDAITWALWGKARTKTDDELISLQATDMEVEYQFLLAGDSYRVIRKRTRAHGGQTLLELQVRQGQDWRAITGNTIRDTERRIIGLLRMEYDTFINSTFLLQGRADEFTVKPPTQRKQILADILGLSVYDDLEAKAKDQAKVHADRARVLGESLRELDAELAHLPEYEQAQHEATGRAAAQAAALRAAEEELRLLRDQKSLLDAKARQAAELKLRLDHTEAEMADARRGLAEQTRRLQEHEALLAQAPEIQAGHAALKDVRLESDETGRKLAMLARLQQDQARLEQAIATQRHALDSGRQVLLSQIADRQTRASQASELAARAAALGERLARLTEAEKEREAARAAILELSERKAGLRAANDRLRADMEDLRRKMDELAGVAECPLCGTGLTPEHRDEIRLQYESEGREKRQSYDANMAAARQVESEAAEAQARLSRADAVLQELPALQRQHAAAEQALALAAGAVKELAALEPQLAATEARLAGDDYAGDERLKLAALRRQMETTGYNREALDAAFEAARRRIAELTPFELRAARLESAGQEVEGERAAVGRYQRQIARYQEVLETDRKGLDALAGDLAGLEEMARRLGRQQAAVDATAAQERQARLELGAAQQRVATCRSQAELRKERAAQESEARQERALYDELAVAFGKRGIQAMLIDEALPELEEEANRLLGRMTDSRLHVRFDTQRETKKGDTVETLDIKISDELGTRSYETYSGGEAFRINFAVRVALSRLLANRAGARLQTLVIDEGFGTQDAQGRERLVEAITSIQGDFEMILAITHIQELKDAFPVHIEVVKTERGSVAQVA